MAHIEENMPNCANSRVYYREIILKKEGNKRWTEYYAVLTERQLIFNRKDSRTGVIIPQNRTVLEITPKTSCAYSEKTCYRFPFYIRNEKGTYYFKCETNLQRYRWMYAVRLASSGKPPEAPPQFIPTKHSRSRTTSQRREITAERHASVTGKRNMGFVKDEQAHGSVLLDKEGHIPHGKNVLIDNSHLESSSRFASTGPSMHSRVNNETTNISPSDFSAWRKYNIQSNGVLNSNIVKFSSSPGSVDHSQKLKVKSESSTESKDRKHAPKHDHNSHDVYGPYAFRKLPEERENPVNYNYADRKADLHIEDLDDEINLEGGNGQAESDSNSSTSRGNRQLQSQVFKSYFSGDSDIELLNGREDSIVDQGVTRTDIIGHKMIVTSDLDYSKSIRRNQRLTRAQAQLLQARAAMKYRENMKSQSWTSLNFIRSPMNTTQRRERSAPALGFSRHRDSTLECLQTEAQIS